MRICVFGCGYVGLVTGACLAESGNHVAAVDTDAAKIARLSAGQCTIFEPRLEQILRDNLAARRLRFTSDAADGLRAAQVIFIAVGTPAGPGGAPDLSAVRACVQSVARHAPPGSVVVIKSTVPVGTGDRLELELASLAGRAIPVVSNPEFLKEGAAVDDFQRPDRVVLGAADRAAAETVASLHRPFVRNAKPMLIVSRAAAEMIKYAANAYLAMRISFINEIAHLCEHLGVDVDEVRRGIGADARIGNHFLYPGLGYGGSCFPKDVQALVGVAAAAGSDSGLFDAVQRRNAAQAGRMVERIAARLGPDLSGRTIAVWGLAFKPNTDDVREAPSIAVIRALLERRAGVVAHDPQAIEAARGVLGEKVRFVGEAYAALLGADALLVATEWMEYRSPDFDRIRAALRTPLIFDGRNLWEPALMAQLGFEYSSVGRATT